MFAIIFLGEEILEENIILTDYFPHYNSILTTLICIDYKILTTFS